MNIKRTLHLTAHTTLALVVVFGATAFAAGAVAPDDGSLLDLGKPVYDAIMSHNYWLAASLALVFAATAFKQYAPGRAGKWANTDAGGSLLVLLIGFGGALGTGLMAQGTAAMSTALLVSAAKVALCAAGGYSMIKKLVVDPLENSDWYKAHAPPWLKYALDLALWAFNRKSDGDKVIADAEKAGADAVADKPGPGADAAVGKPEELK